MSRSMKGWKALRLHRRGVRLWRLVTGTRHKSNLPLVSAFVTSTPRRRSAATSINKKLSNYFRRLLLTPLVNKICSVLGPDKDTVPLLDVDRSPPPPKGHLAVYVGLSPSSSRYVVPVVYFNHPLFEELLQEAAEEFGYEHRGGINIPCPVERFERVRTWISAAGGGRKCDWRLRRKCPV